MPEARPANDPGPSNGQDSTEGWNRFEDEAIAFHERVRTAYLELAKREPHRWVILDASQPPASVQTTIWMVVSSALRASSQVKS